MITPHINGNRFSKNNQTKDFCLYSDFSELLNVYGLSRCLCSEWTADGVCLLFLKELHQFHEDFVCEEKAAGGQAEMGAGLFYEL